MAGSAVASGIATKVVLLGRTNSSQIIVDELTDKITRKLFPKYLQGIPRLKLFGAIKLVISYIGYLIHLLKLKPDLIHCHGLPCLPPCAIAAKVLRAPLVYDAHELETERFGLKGLNKLFDKTVERAFIRAPEAILVVGRSIGDWYKRTYSNTNVIVVRNVPAVAFRAQTKYLLPARNSGDVRFIYLGLLSQGRRIEQLLRIFKKMPANYKLVFVGFGELEPIIREAANQVPNIYLAPAVPPAEVIGIAEQADVGIVGVESVCESYRLCSPNKLFEYLSANIPVVAPNYPEIREVVEATNGGWIVDDEADNAWLETFVNINQQAIKMRKSQMVPLETKYSWDAEWKKLAEVYQSMKSNECIY